MSTSISVVIVSDYRPSEDKEIEYLASCVEALAHQTFEGPVDHILVASAPLSEATVSSLLAILPSLRIEVLPGGSSPEMKVHGAHGSVGEVVAFIDADCIPAPGWLDAISATLRECPSAAAVSGSTIYAQMDLFARVHCLIGRGIMEEARRLPTQRLSNHNFAIRRACLDSIAVPPGLSPFSGSYYAKKLRDAGFVIVFDPAARTVHAYEGWDAECDIRRNNGHAFFNNRFIFPDLRLRYGWVARLRYLGLPIYYFGRILQTWIVCLSRFKSFGVAWYELPFALGLAPVSMWYELAGAVTAVRGKQLADTAYR
ncbi:MAG: glycosyltransferase [Alphaproteobacteria bacterium]